MLMVAEFSTVFFCTTMSMTSEERDYFHSFDVVSHIIAERIIRTKDIVVV